VFGLRTCRLALVFTVSLAMAAWGCSAVGSRSCVGASPAMYDSINAGMDDPGTTSVAQLYVAPATNLIGPPVVATFRNPVWVAGRVFGYLDKEPPLWLAEESGDGFVYVANDTAREVSFLGRDLGGPQLSGDGAQAALDCAANSP
jgi:hypothetical protein